MQFDTNSDMPTLDAQAPIPFPSVDPSPCARITVRVWHRNTMMTVQNVLVKTTTTAATTTTTGPGMAARRTSGVLAAALPLEVMQRSHNNNNDDDDQNMSSSSSSFSSDDDDDEMLDDLDASANAAAVGTNDTSSHTPECAYWMQRTIRDAIYGRVVLAVVLTRMPPKATTSATATGPAAVAEWQVTDQKCAIKEMSWQHIRRERHRLAEDPIQEVAALYYLQQQYFAVPPTVTTTTTTTTPIVPSWENPFVSTGVEATAAVVAATTTNPDSAMLQTSIQSNILLPLDLLSDDRYLYSILPFCNGGELFDRLDRREKFPEPEARYWMHQILNGVEHLQKAGICHRDLSLENLLVHDSSALVIDMGMCLRIPHVGGAEEEAGMQPLTTTTTTTTSITTTATAITSTVMETTTSNVAGPLVASMDHMHLNSSPTTATSAIYQMHLSNATGTTATATTTTNTNVVATIDHRLLSRHWITPQGTCGKWIYMSPEIYKNQQPFDGHAVDMWAVGVILFLMLTGFPPWERACATDERFYYMTQGYLVQMLTEWNLGLSSDAMDLLQRMFWVDPQDRLSLEQVKAHPWMLKPEVTPPPAGIV